MKLKSRQLAPYLLAALALAVVLGVEVTSRWGPRWDFFQRLEWMTFDWRAKQASHWPAPVSPDLGFVFFSDETIAFFSDSRRLGTNYSFGLYWPRHLYAQVLRELGAQGAKVVGLDVLFGELRHDYDHVLLPGPDKKGLPSDLFFQHMVGELGNVVLGASPQVQPHRLFRVAAADLGDISVDTDADGVFRRIKPFKDYRIWHEDIRMEALINNWDLDRAEVRSNALCIPTKDQTLKLVPLEDGFFRPALLLNNAETNSQALEPAYQDLRVWHMGIVLTAKVLGLDLEQAKVDLESHRIVLAGTNGVQRILPLDARDSLVIDWPIRPNDPRLTQEAFESVWAKDFSRQLGTNHPPRFKDKLVVIGSMATGNDLADRGATPVDKHAFLTSNHWNVANSVLTGRFIQPASAATALLLILGFGLASVAATLGLRPLSASALVTLLGIGLWTTGLWLFIWQRYWLPLVTPLASLALAHGTLLSYRAFFEQSERRRIRGIFTKIVSPDIVSELLDAEKLPLGGARREVTVFFADVRGFTEYIDSNHAKAEEHIRELKLQGPAAEAWADLQASEALQTVNMYLGMIAEIIKKHNGTLDKYIGDAVVAMFGAPIALPDHALRAVRAALAMRDALPRVNQDLVAMNLLAPDARLSMRIGLATGPAIVGNFGSEQRFDYTAMGDTMNLASRLEEANRWLSSHILVPETTRNACGSEVLFRRFGPCHLRGKAKPLILYEPLAPEPAPPALRAMADAFNRAVDALAAKDLAAAESALAECLELQPDDGPVQALKQRIEAVRAGALAPDEPWNLTKSK